VGGGPFTSISSTFNVPTITASTADNTDIAIWDGFEDASGHDIIQAGVGTGSYHLVDGSFQWYAWLYISPSDMPVMSIPVAVSAGDEVTVNLVEASVGNWTISFTDDTTGASSSTSQVWGEAAVTAEWIVESPPGTPAFSLTSYSPTVDFTDLTLTGPQGGCGEWVMSQNGVTVAEPTALARSGFSISNS
jgi:hypothetical protein